MKRILKKILILIVILNFMAIIVQIISINKIDAMTTNLRNENSLQNIKEKGAITVASPLYDFPFYYINSESNEISGIDAEIITEIAKRLGINKVEIKETLFVNLLEKLNAEKSIDLAAGGIYITPEREEIVSFTEPLYKESETIIVPRFSKINFMNDLETAVVGVEKGTVFMELAKKWKENKMIKDVVAFENTSLLLEAVNNQKVDAGLADRVAVNSLMAKEQNLILRLLKDYSPQLPGTIGIAVRKNDISLLNGLNEKIREMKADGTLYSILLKYGLDKSNVV